MRARRRAPRRGAEYYQGAYFNALESGDILTAVRFPVPAAGHGYAYEKLKRKIGDSAAAAAAIVTVSGGRGATCAIGLTNVADTALFAAEAAQAVVGTALCQARSRRLPAPPRPRKARCRRHW